MVSVRGTLNSRVKWQNFIVEREGVLKKFTFILIIIVIICIVFSKKIFSIDDHNASESKLYINVFDPKSLKFTFYHFDQIQNKSKLLFSKETADYTAFAFSERTNKLYFADGISDHTIQLFENDLNTNQINQLTTIFNNVDLIQIDKEKKIIFMRVLLRDAFRNFHIATYNLETQKIKIWEEENNDRSVLDFNYNPNNNQLIVVSFSENEHQKKLTEANKNQTKLQPTKHSLDIYDIEGQKKKHIADVERFISGASLAPDASSVIISYDEAVDSPISHVVEIDNQSKKVKPLLNSTGIYSNIRSVKFDEKKEGFYFLSSFIDEKKGYSILKIPKESVLSYFDIKKNKVRNVWRAEKSVIVNYSAEHF
ncbi:hypothetical protein AMS59_21165 [Lysinibacillus sp. FJAT-14745]|uniref:hypothetical protein n=1 Tax=Lysinibacillus sp. FJAT-14745 TaxID=1704289 RepID=UPI0006AB8294|nr:hypothetical protein [Lysinibacillus sp. FJAT-14745]KOP70326.1 hypothetical protein AMS59_21165 [Lysinibacillus sp. FJAT-14745]